MPKKMGTNSKAEEARARKNATETERKDRESRDKEDQYWREAEGNKSRAAKKREDEASKRAEAAARKAEARRLAELEEKELEKAGKKPDKKENRVSIPVPKVTEAELQRRREEEQLQILRRAEETKKRQVRTADEEEYERMVLVSNTNREDSLIEAHSVEDAISRMAVADNLPVDRHPERRLKASFKNIPRCPTGSFHLLLLLLPQNKMAMQHPKVAPRILKLPEIHECMVHHARTDPGGPPVNLSLENHPLLTKTNELYRRKRGGDGSPLEGANLCQDASN
ncbi:hypothetical protein HHK36_031135 [Tetracentron sinense]|uniref:Coiled-coil domain-containing protein n=1 Tax=Tetracentron sinense TaxID=13715 RepID=A0A834YCB7_TETSI|nr:hypothetical protein HHK36_031135 [Tetracentron sinense]